MNTPEPTKPKPIYHGIKIVTDVPKKILPITGAPAGRQRLRFRDGKPARLFVKTENGILEYWLEDCGHSWHPKLCQGRNLRAKAIAKAAALERLKKKP